MPRSQPGANAQSSIREALDNAEVILPPLRGQTGPRIPSEADGKPEVPMSQLSKKSDLSHLSGMSQTTLANPNWSDLERDLFEERAAIIQHDAGFPRSRAEYLARRFVDMQKLRRMR